MNRSPWKSLSRPFVLLRISSNSAMILSQSSIIPSRSLPSESASLSTFYSSSNSLYLFSSSALSKSITFYFSSISAWSEPKILSFSTYSLFKNSNSYLNLDVSSTFYWIYKLRASNSFVWAVSSSNILFFSSNKSSNCLFMFYKSCLKELISWSFKLGSEFYKFLSISDFFESKVWRSLCFYLNASLNSSSLPPLIA